MDEAGEPQALPRGFSHGTECNDDDLSEQRATQAAKTPSVQSSSRLKTGKARRRSAAAWVDGTACNETAARNWPGEGCADTSCGRALAFVCWAEGVQLHPFRSLQARQQSATNPWLRYRFGGRRSWSDRGGCAWGCWPLARPPGLGVEAGPWPGSEASFGDRSWLARLGFHRSMLRM